MTTDDRSRILTVEGLARVEGEGADEESVDVDGGVVVVVVDGERLAFVLAADAGPVTEYLHPSSRFPVGNAPRLVERLEGIAAAYPDRLDQLEALVESHLDTARLYGLEAEERSILEAWRAILARS